MKKLSVFIALIAFFGLTLINAQSREITGTVTSSEDGMGIPGANVIVKGTTVGVATDLDGKFLINVPEGNNVLTFDALGFTPQEIKISGSVINVVLASSSISLDEVVVVAYGTAKKSSFTGSASVVKPKALQNVSGGVVKALQGTVAGVQVVGEDIRIRGFGSFTADATPLYVIDGIAGAPMPNDTDVESITVLKDASATALYGSRAANGIIMVTTKKGDSDKAPVFNAKYQFGVKQYIKPKYDLMNAAQHYNINWIGLKNQHLNGNRGDETGAINYANDNLASNFKDHNPYNMTNPFNNDGSLKDGAQLLYSTDWRDEILRTATFHDANISVSGGSKRSQYYWSANYYDSKGLIESDNYTDFVNKFNFSADLRDYIKVGINTSAKYYTSGDVYLEKANENNLLYVATQMTPVVPLYLLKKNVNADGSWTYEKDLDINGDAQYEWSNPTYQNYNPIALMKMDPRDKKSFNIFIAPWLRLQPMKGLTINANASSLLVSSRYDRFQNPFFGSGATEKGLSFKGSVFSTKWTSHLSANYQFDLNENHGFEILAAMEAEQYEYKNNWGNSKGFPLGDVSTELNIGAKPKSTSSETLETGLISYFSNIKYDYKDRYYISASFRRDGSSKFGPDHRWGNFWSVGASWRLSEEDFIKDIEAINDMTVRASYGVTGTDAIGSYKFGDYYSLGETYMGNPGMVHTRLPNPDLHWEQNENLTIGVEFRAFNFLKGTIEYYTRNTNDLLMSVPLPVTTGFKEIFKNIGEINNQGFEIELNSTNYKNVDFTWSTTLSLTYNKNEITSLPQAEMIDGTKRYVVGGTLYDYYLREWAGVDKLNGDPLWYMDEVDANGVKTGKRALTNDYSAADKYNVGKSTPDLFGAIGNNFEYMGFDLGIQLYYSLGGEIYDGLYAGYMHDGADGSGGQMSVDALDFWTLENTNASLPKYVYDNTSKSNSTSSRWLVNGDYLKIKNIAVGYTLSEKSIKRFGLSYMRVFATVDNIYTFSAFKSGDPEMRLSGVGTSYAMPNTINYRLGLTVRF